MSILYEHYETGADNHWNIYVGWPTQTFTPSKTHKITAVELPLYRPPNNFPGLFTVSIRNTDETGKPTGNDLCSGSIDGNSVVASQSRPNPLIWSSILMTPSICLTANTTYAIIGRTPTADAYNVIRWVIDTFSSTYPGGQRWNSSDFGVSWTNLLPAITDALFREFGPSKKINIGVAWKDVVGGKVNIDGVWKDVVGEKINVGDEWKMVF